MILTLFISFPTAYWGSRLFKIFFYPYNQWSFDLLIDKVLFVKGHTFHSGIIPLAILISILILLMHFRYKETVDTLFLYAPLNIAMLRFGCFLVGCCWGNHITLECFGKICYNYVNPVPLYSIMLNILLFIFLRKCYNKIYLSEDKKYRGYSGSIVSFFLVLYGMIRFSLGFLRNERIVLWGMSQAQIVMIFFILLGLIILVTIHIKVNKNIT